MNTDLTNNRIYLLDSYKDLHAQMLPEGTKHSFQYLESRGGSMYPYTVSFGAQYIIKRWLEGRVITKQEIDAAEPNLDEHFKFSGDVWDRKNWDYIVDKHDGMLPVSIKVAPEGTKVPVSNIMMSVESTDENCAWLPGALETVLQQVWAPSTICTRSKVIMDVIKKYFRDTVDDDLQWLADFYLHDFGMRAATCMEHAGLGGMAHLVNSKGTDTKMGAAYAMKYYGATKEGLAYSVPASEHSIATSLGKTGEFAVAKRLLRMFPKGILSHVSDSYDITSAIKAYNEDPEFRELILGRAGKFVARPDSPRFKNDTPQDQILWITQQWDNGYTSRVNSKGYKDLDPHVGTIYGDSLTEDNIEDSLALLQKNGYSALASVFGCGGYLMTRLNRDTQRQAFKCSAQLRNGAWHDIYKDPLDKTKSSKRGRLKLVIGDNGYETVRENDPRENQLVEVFRNGRLTKEWTFDEVRARANS